MRERIAFQVAMDYLRNPQEAVDLINLVLADKKPIRITQKGNVREDIVAASASNSLIEFDYIIPDGSSVKCLVKPLNIVQLKSGDGFKGADTKTGKQDFYVFDRIK